MAFETSAGYPGGPPRLHRLNAHMVLKHAPPPAPKLQPPEKQAREMKIARAKMKKLSQALARRP